jgi:hypothetical protein
LVAAAASVAMEASVMAATVTGTNNIVYSKPVCMFQTKARYEAGCWP